MNKNRFSYIILLPTILIVAIAIIYPVCLSFIYSLQYYKLTKIYNKKFIGIENYKELLSNKIFYNTLLNTSIVVLVVLILGVIISFLIALLLEKNSKISNFLMGVAIIPWALPPVVNGVIWKFIFYPEFGLINKIAYTFFNLKKPLLWLNDHYISLIIFGIIIAWRAIPFCAIVLLANIKGIPDEIFEASEIDGATRYQQIKYIVIPTLLPTFTLVVVNLILTGISVFDEIIALVGFRNLGQTYMVYNYTETFTFLNIGFGSAISYTLTLICGFIAYIFVKGERKNEK